MPDAGGAREVDRPGELGDERHHRVDRGGRVVAHRDIERFGRHVLFGVVGETALDAGGNRLDDRRMEQSGVGRARELVRERLGLLWREVDPERLDGDQAVAVRFIGAKDGTKRAHTDLMQHPEGAELSRGSEGGGVVSRQGYASGDRKNVPQVAGFDGCGRLDRSRAIGVGSSREVTASNRSDAASSERNGTGRLP